MGGLLVRAGVDMGSDLVPADRANPRGYHEDRDVVDFHGGLFRELLPRDATGHVDWGWTETATLDSDRLDEFLPRARRIADRRAAECTRRGCLTWGFKDPRATVVLDFWDRCLADLGPKYVFVYRPTWRVADSMQRLGADVFLRNPSYAYEIWLRYNERLLDFYVRNRDRSVLLNVDALPSGLTRLCELLSGKIGLDIEPDDLAGTFDERLLTRSDADDPLASLVAAGYPRCVELLAQLEAEAALPGEPGAPRKVTAGTTPLRGPGQVEPCEVTIVIPTRNDAVYLLESLASVERCRPEATEVIVVNDGSDDAGSLRILDGLRRRGHFILDRPHRGLSAARNAGITRGRGRFILPLDADNRLRPGFIEAGLDALRSDSGLGVVYGDRQLFGGDTVRLVAPPFDLQRIAHGNFVDACALFRRDLWEDVGGYDESLRGLEDWEIWLHAGSRGWRFRHLDLIALDYRVRPGSLVTQCISGRNWTRLTARIRSKHAETFRRLLPRPVGRAADVLGSLLPHRTRAAWHRSLAAVYWRVTWSRHRLRERVEGMPRRLARRFRRFRDSSLPRFLR
jgi:glycosyltransferase involved in cell wall biosynthesis